jgi:ubiquinone/menaquinone biosynthesis C-methylase UbiE
MESERRTPMTPTSDEPALDARWLDRYYDAYPRIEDEFKDVLDAGLSPRGPDMLYDLVSKLQLEPGASAVDLGCGEGRQSIELATRFGFIVEGVDPVPRHIELANEELARAAQHEPALGSRVHFSLGNAEKLGVPDATVDLVWCRDVLVHVAALDKAYAECCRILRAGGHVLVYQMFGTDRLEPREAEWLWSTMGVVPTSADPPNTEDAIAHAGLRIDERIELGSEWGEASEENTQRATRHLLHASRLLRDRDRYIRQFGEAAYDIKLGDCLWHIYLMIGKLSARIYLLSRRFET